MTLDFGFVASSAFATSDGHLSALAIGSDTFYSQSYAERPPAAGSVPGVVGSPISFSVVARFIANLNEVGEEYPVGIRIADFSGASILTGQISVTVPPVRSDVPPSWAIPINLVVPLSFGPNAFGEYRVHLVVAGETMKSMAFRVVPAAG